ncbi:ABC transporter permease [Pendulispora brunnea]|uniref:ABC transporter permease n=1 Tax=Pendulispora brunnea TaxID=2905690 RepID=A0ABZ2K7V7_9BACT
MFRVFFVLTRNELRGYFRRKASIFWALIFPIFLLGVMLVAFGRSNSLGEVRVVFEGDTASGTAQSCRRDIEEAFTKAPVKARYSGDSGADTVLIVFPDGDAPARVLYDFNGPLASKAAARTIEIAMIGCVARARGMPSDSVVRFENTTTGKAPFDYGHFFATGILVMAFMIIGMNSTAEGIATLRERNTFKIYVCFPVSRLVFLGSVLTARIVMMLLSATLLLLVARYGFGIQLPLWRLQALRAIPIVLIGSAMLLSFGTLLASRGRSLAEVELWCNLTYYPLLFFSDLTIPLTAVPGWLRGAIHLIPTNQFAVAMRGVFIENASYAQMAFPIVAMACWALLALTLGTLRFRWYQD